MYSTTRDIIGSAYGDKEDGSKTYESIHRPGECDLECKERLCLKYERKSERSCAKRKNVE